MDETSTEDLLGIFSDNDSLSTVTNWSESHPHNVSIELVKGPSDTTLMVAALYLTVVVGKYTLCMYGEMLVPWSLLYI
ncbi:hypothetical protein PoB_006676600 [Plakobranchus ocellatus]|uniref:Uncharacterized protein n=1 Tax=Plakobranchus ocellatus TaxID=259542 RepID=A0AAV4D8J5_9GAST|nr:hypothetical protein PoB_006676600 [Plakobranchus ocellatus]